MRLAEIQSIEPSSAEEQQQCQDKGNQQADPLADTAVAFSPFLLSGAQRLTRQRHCRYLHAVRKREAQAQDAHADIVRRELIRSQPGRNHGRRQEADPRRDILQGRIQRQMPDGLRTVP